jgi:hypothetical protein
MDKINKIQKFVLKDLRRIAEKLLADEVDFLQV